MRATTPFFFLIVYFCSACFLSSCSRIDGDSGAGTQPSIVPPTGPSKDFSGQASRLCRTSPRRKHQEPSFSAVETLEKSLIF